MSWNYRVIRQDEGGGEYNYEIHEVYYNDDGSIWAIAESASYPGGDSVEELQKDYEMMREAFNLPALDANMELAEPMGPPLRPDPYVSSDPLRVKD
jgi:hypothetical protein